jgi:hypothetical protein
MQVLALRAMSPAQVSAPSERDASTRRETPPKAEPAFKSAELINNVNELLGNVAPRHPTGVRGIAAVSAVGSDRSNVVVGIVSLGSPWKGTELADQPSADLAGLFPGGGQAIHDAEPKHVEDFIAKHPVRAPHFGVAGDRHHGAEVMGECAAGGLIFSALALMTLNKKRRRELRQNDGIVTVRSALPSDVTPLGRGVYHEDHYDLVRDPKVAADIIREVKSRLPKEKLAVCLVNGFSGGHLATDEVLGEVADAVGADHLFILPTNKLDHVHDIEVPAKEGTAKIKCLGERGLLLAGMDSIEQQSEWVAEKVRYLQDQGLIAPGTKVLLVGHSLGGLASHGATYLLENGLKKLPD